jgi:hypothetical protein
MPPPPAAHEGHARGELAVDASGGPQRVVEAGKKDNSESDGSDSEDSDSQGEAAPNEDISAATKAVEQAIMAKFAANKAAREASAAKQAAPAPHRSGPEPHAPSTSVAARAARLAAVRASSVDAAAAVAAMTKEDAVMEQLSLRATGGAQPVSSRAPEAVRERDQAQAQHVAEVRQLQQANEGLQTELANAQHDLALVRADLASAELKAAESARLARHAETKHSDDVAAAVAAAVGEATAAAAREREAAVSAMQAQLQAAAAERDAAKAQAESVAKQLAAAESAALQEAALLRSQLAVAQEEATAANMLAQEAVQRSEDAEAARIGAEAALEALQSELDGARQSAQAAAEAVAEQFTAATEAAGAAAAAAKEVARLRADAALHGADSRPATPAGTPVRDTTSRHVAASPGTPASAHRGSAEADSLRAENAALRHRLAVSDAALTSLRGAASAAQAAGRLTDELAALRVAGQEANAVTGQQVRDLQEELSLLRSDLHDSEQRCESLVAALDVAAAEAEAARQCAAASQHETMEAKAQATAAHATLVSERRRIEDAMSMSREEVTALRAEFAATRGELAGAHAELSRLKSGVAASDTLFTAALERALELALDRAMADAHSQLSDARRAVDMARAEAAGLRAQLAAAAANAMGSGSGARASYPGVMSLTSAVGRAMPTSETAQSQGQSQAAQPLSGAAGSSASRHASAMSDAVAAAHATTARLNAAAERLRRWGVGTAPIGAAQAPGQASGASPWSSSTSTPRESDAAWARSYLQGGEAGGARPGSRARAS